MNIGVLAIQGDVSEHLYSIGSALKTLGIEGRSIEVRRTGDLQDLKGLLIPGGESSTISMQMRNSGLWNSISEFAKNGGAIMGTCAGCIMIASELEGQEKKGHVQPLNLMHIAVNRNAYGRQRESFEVPLNIKGIEGEFHAVFIRAPAITRTWGGVDVLATINEEVVMARQDNVLALTFHPELVPDTGVHEYFLKMIL